MQIRVSDYTLVILPNPIPKLQHTPLPPKCYEPRNVPRLLTLPLFSLQTHIWVYQGAWEHVTYLSCSKIFFYKYLFDKKIPLVIPLGDHQKWFGWTLSGVLCHIGPSTILNHQGNHYGGFVGNHWKMGSMLNDITTCFPVVHDHSYCINNKQHIHPKWRLGWWLNTPYQYVDCNFSIYRTSYSNDINYFHT